MARKFFTEMKIRTIKNLYKKGDDRIFDSNIINSRTTPKGNEEIYLKNLKHIPFGKTIDVINPRTAKSIKYWWLKKNL